MGVDTHDTFAMVGEFVMVAKPAVNMDGADHGDRAVFLETVDNSRHRLPAERGDILAEIKGGRWRIFQRLYTRLHGIGHLLLSVRLTASFQPLYLRMRMSSASDGMKRLSRFHEPANSCGGGKSPLCKPAR